MRQQRLFRLVYRHRIGNVLTPLLSSPVAEHAALHSRVGLDAADEVARRAEQGFVEVLHRAQESLGHCWLHQGLQRVSDRIGGLRVITCII